MRKSQIIGTLEIRYATMPSRVAADIGGARSATVSANGCVS